MIIRRLFRLGTGVVLLVLAALPTGLKVHRATAAGFTPEIVFDLSDVQQRGFDAFDVVATYSRDGHDFIGIAGTAIGSADGYNNWVFFYDGTTYLGTDTAQSSPGLQLLGSVRLGRDRRTVRQLRAKRSTLLPEPPARRDHLHLLRRPSAGPAARLPDTE